MLEKFVNDELSESGIDNMMFDYYQKKEELEFKKKWNKIINEELEKHKLVEKRKKKYFFRFSSIAAMILLLIFGNIYFFQNTGNSIKYSISSKGNLTQIKDIKNIANQTFKLHEQSLKINARHDYDLFVHKEYIKLLNSKENITNLNNEEKLLIALAAIKRSNFQKARKYLKDIDKNSSYFKNTSKIIELTNEILE